MTAPQVKHRTGTIIVMERNLPDRLPVRLLAPLPRAPAAGPLRQLAARVVHHEGPVVPLEHRGELRILEPFQEAPGESGPSGRRLPHDPPALDLDGDVEVLPAVADHEERLLDLLTDRLGLEDLDRK